MNRSKRSADNKRKEWAYCRRSVVVLEFVNSIENRDIEEIGTSALEVAGNGSNVF